MIELNIFLGLEFPNDITLGQSVTMICRFTVRLNQKVWNLVFHGLYLNIRIKLVYNFILPKLSLKCLAIRKNAIEKGCVTYGCLVQRDEGEGGGGLGPFFPPTIYHRFRPPLLEPQRVSQNRVFFSESLYFCTFS